MRSLTPRLIPATSVLACALWMGSAFAAVPPARLAPPAPPVRQPEDPARYPLELANVHLRYDQPERAVVELQNAEKLAKDEQVKAQIYMAWADASIQLKDAAKGVQFFEKALAATQDVEQKCRYAAQFAAKLSDRGHLDEAVKYYEYVEANSKQEMQQRVARMQKVFAYRRAGKLQEFCQDAEARLEKNPKDEAALRNLLLVYTIAIQNQDKAFEYSKRLAELRPDDKEVLRNLARSHMMKRNADEAVAVYQKLIQLDPQSKATYYSSILSAYQFAGKHQEAVTWAQKLAEEQPDAAFSWSQLAECYANCDNFDKSVESQQKAMSLARNPAEKDQMSLGLGQIYERAKRYREAKLVYHQLSEQASSPDMRRLGKQRLIGVYEKTGELDKVKIEPPK